MTIYINSCFYLNHLNSYWQSWCERCVVRPIFISIISTEPRITRADHTDHHTLSPLEAGLGLGLGSKKSEWWYWERRECSQSRPDLVVGSNNSCYCWQCRDTTHQPTGRQVSLSPERPLHVVEDLVRADWVEDPSSSQQVILHNQISEIFILITMD